LHLPARGVLPSRRVHRRPDRAHAAGPHAAADRARQHPRAAPVRDLLRAVLLLPRRHPDLARRAQPGGAADRARDHGGGAAAAGRDDLAAAAGGVPGERGRGGAGVGGTGADAGVDAGHRADPVRALRPAGAAVRGAGAVHGAQHDAAVAGAEADLRHRSAGRCAALPAPRGPQHAVPQRTVGAALAPRPSVSGFGCALSRERECPCPPPERFESSASAPPFRATLRRHSKPAASCCRRRATRLGYALPGRGALWAKSRRRPKAGGHSPKGLPYPARSASRSGLARQSRRKYSTVVTTRTFLTWGLLWSRSLMVTTPWFALRIPPRREPESLANCSADSRAAAVASAISSGLMSLSLV